MRDARLSYVKGLILWFGVTFLAATVGAIASIDAKVFYNSLNRPTWAPPGWVFGPVWTVLFILMASAAFLVWLRRGEKAVKLPLVLYFCQLGLNALWSWIFFRWHQGSLAVAEIVLLWVVLLFTVVQFWRIRPLAGALLVPYLAWVTFAFCLAWEAWRRNPQLLG